MENLRIELAELQSKVIGLFKHKYSNSQFELVIDDNNGILKTIRIGSLGGLIETNIGKENGKYIKFPNGKKLSTMLYEPFELDKFVKQFD